MSLVAGITCDSSSIYVSVVEDGAVVEGMPERVRVPGGLEEHDRLWAVYDDVVRVLSEVKPDKLVLLFPETQYKGTHGQLSPRITLETIVRMAASKQQVPTELLHRATVRARLDLPKSGKLESHLDGAIRQPVGQYWTTGRGLAAMAALAGERA